MKQIKISNQITVRDGISIEKYFNDISRIKLLDAKEEEQISAKAKEGDDEAIKALVTANLRFVVSIAKQYQNQGLPLSDLINEGNIGLIKAAQRFDTTRGFKFISYAVYWIRQSMLQALAECSRLVRIPANKFGKLNRMSQTMSDMRQNLGRKPTEEELAKELKIKKDDVTSYLNASGKPLSIDEPLGGDSDNTVQNLIVDHSAPEPSENIMREAAKEEIRHILKKALSPYEANVIIYSFGLNGVGYLSLEEISNKLELSYERVRQMREKALRKLKRSSYGNMLKSYLA